MGRVKEGSMIEKRFIGCVAIDYKHSDGETHVG